jgi:hypothetical protein
MALGRHHLFAVVPQYSALINNLILTTDRCIMCSYTTLYSLSNSQGTKPRMAPGPLVWSVALRASRDITIQASIEYVFFFFSEFVFRTHVTTDKEAVTLIRHSSRTVSDSDRTGPDSWLLLADRPLVVNSLNISLYPKSMQENSRRNIGWGEIRGVLSSLLLNKLIINGRPCFTLLLS